MYFPSLYADEHIYSGLIRSRYLSGQMFVNDKRFFELNELPYHWIRSQTPLCSHFKKVINKVTNNPEERFKLRLFHTPFAPWLLSLPPESEAHDLVDSGMRNNLEENPFATDRRWKFCPTCAEEEVEKLGISYWHSSHQSLGARVCPAHKAPLYTHDEIRYLDFTLPHHNIEKSEPLLIDSKWQQEWQPFIYSLTTHIQKNINWPASLSSFIKEHLGLNEKIKRRDKPVIDKHFERMKNDLGTECLAGLFNAYARDYPKKPNILWLSLSDFGQGGSIRHPLYWLSILFWLRHDIPGIKALL